MPKVKEYVNNPGSQGGEDEGDDETTKEHRDAIGDGGSYNSNCTCGRLSSSDIKLNPINHCDNNNLSSRNNKKKNNIWLESSFVHLMTPINIRTKTLQNTNDNHHHPSDGYGKITLFWVILISARFIYIDAYPQYLYTPGNLLYHIAV